MIVTQARDFGGQSHAESLIWPHALSGCAPISSLSRRRAELYRYGNELRCRKNVHIEPDAEETLADKFNPLAGFNEPAPRKTKPGLVKLKTASNLQIAASSAKFSNGAAETSTKVYPAGASPPPYRYHWR